MIGIVDIVLDIGDVGVLVLVRRELYFERSIHDTV